MSQRIDRPERVAGLADPVRPARAGGTRALHADRGHMIGGVDADGILPPSLQRIAVIR